MKPKAVVQEMPAAVAPAVAPVVPAAVVPEWQKYNPDINDQFIDHSAREREVKAREYKQNITNEPYKPITKIDLNRRYCESKDLLLEADVAISEQEAKRRLEEALKERESLNAKVNRYYSDDRKEEHKKRFEYSQQQIYRGTEEVATSADLLNDRKEFYSKTLEESQQRKQQYNSLLDDLSKLGIL